MKKINLFLATMLMLLLSACNSGPVVHHSISGTWRCTEYSDAGNRDFLVDIWQKQNDTTQYVIGNFYNMGDVEYITAKYSAYKVTVPQQGISSVTVKSGSGVVNSTYTQMDMNYIVYDGRDIAIQAVFTRK